MNLNKQTQIISGLTAFVFILKFSEAFILFGHGDALFYHLPLAKMWKTFGLFKTYENLCNGLLTGYFDHLYYLTVNAFSSLWKGQLASQAFHFLVSKGAAALFFLLYFRKRKSIALLGSLAILTISVSSDFFVLAKNDGALAIVSLLCAVYTFDSRSKKNPYIIGLLLGLMPALKMNGIFMTIPISLIYTSLNYKQPLHIIKAASTAFLVWAPLLFRNWYFIGSPIFPGLVSSFPGEATPEMIKTYTRYMSSSLTLTSLIASFKTFFMGKAIILLGLGLLLKQRRLKEFWPYIVTSISYLLIYLLVNGGIHFPRHFFPVIFLNLFLTFKLLEDKEIQAKYIWIILAFILVDSKIDKSLARIPRLYSQMQSALAGPKLNISHYTHRAELWEAVEVKQGVIKVISDDFNEHYYAPKGTLLHSSECTVQGMALKRCDQKDFLRLQSYDYAVLKDSTQNKCYEYIRSKPVLKEVGAYKLYRLNL